MVLLRKQTRWGKATIARDGDSMNGTVVIDERHLSLIVIPTHDGYRRSRHMSQSLESPPNVRTSTGYPHIARLMTLKIVFLAGMALPASSQAQAVPDPSAEAHTPRTNLQRVVRDSIRLLVMEHSVRVMAQAKTRRELGGPFWKDYRRAVHVPQQWSDGDGWLINYVGHPGHGAAAGFIWTQSDPSSPATPPRFTRQYWLSRARATAWSAAYSLQFELGPLSEASIGNVGRNRDTAGWVDHVMTPLGGFAVMVAEDALDRYVIRAIERRIGYRAVQASLRMALNPARSIANVAGVRVPWHRDSRPLRRGDDPESERQDAGECLQEVNGRFRQPEIPAFARCSS